MKGKGIKAFGFALLGALALLFTGCGQQGSGGKGPTPTTGKVSLVVTTDDGASPQPYTATYTPAISDPSAVTPGDYEVKVQKSGYFDAYARFTVRAGETTTVTVRLQKLPAGGPNTGTVAVLVVNQNGQPIQGATVSDGTNSGTTDAQGRVDFTYNTPGAVAISVNASGYLGDAQLASVELGKVTALTYRLRPQSSAPTTGTVVVHVYGQDTGSTLAGASVSSDPSLTFSGSNPFTATGAPGTYKITASASGYNTGNRAVQIEAGKTVVLNLGLTKKAISGPVYSLEIVSVKDQWGVGLPKRREENDNKTVDLYAAQTEEYVCVTVKVTDGQNPVQNARVRVSATAQDRADYIHLAPGCVSQPSAELDFVMTDGNGEAKFTIFSTGVRSGLYTFDPVKFVVSASGDSWTADLKEFKVFFWNISHLYYKDNDGNTKKVAKRTGDNLGTITNAYDFNNAQNNDHVFESFVYQKQPQDGPYYPGRNLPGYMVYTLTGGDTGKVQWVQTGGGVDSCEVISPDGLTCQDTNGSGVILQPRPGVTASDLPISVEVKATLQVQVSYGNTLYTFALKDYTFTKTWTGAALKIEKSGPSIIGWSGEDLSPSDVTLVATGAGVPSGATYTYTITVTNTSATETAQNVVITDPLPAELGFVSASDGGTYDPILHQVTWNQTTTPSLTSIGPGQSVSVTVTVYARHKPGYIWSGASTTDPGQPGYYYSTRPPSQGTINPYTDPYLITNPAVAKGDNTPRVTTSKDIYVVRPFLKLSKTPTRTTVFQGDRIRFTLTVTNVDRASAPISDPDYQQLKNNFPTDYANALTAYNVQVRDLFGEGLDYVNSSPAGTLDGDGKTLTFELGNLALGGSQSILVDLEASEVGDWENCARLYAFNLNQPQVDPNSGVPRWNVPPDQFEPADGNGTDPRPSPPYTLENGNPDTVGNYLQSCATVTVNPRPAQYALAISSLGEFTQLTGGDSTDPVQEGSLYVYRFDVRAWPGSTGSQTGVRFVVTRTAGNSTFTGATKGVDYEVQLSTDGGNTFTTVLNSAITVNSSSSTTFDITYNNPLNAGDILRIAIRATAVNGTNTDVTATASSNQAPPVTVIETTTIIP